MVKLIIGVRRMSGLTRTEFSTYWRDQHGPLVKSVPEFISHVRKYVQCHLVTGDSPFGGEAGYDGVAELWFDSSQDMTRAFNEPRYLAIIRPDELKFVDITNCISFVTEEVPMV